MKTVEEQTFYILVKSNLLAFCFIVCDFCVLTVKFVFLPQVWKTFVMIHFELILLMALNKSKIIPLVV